VEILIPTFVKHYFTAKKLESEDSIEAEIPQALMAVKLFENRLKKAAHSIS